MLLKIKPSVVPSLGMIHYLVREKIFAELTFTQQAQLDYGFEKWTHKALLTHDEKWELQRAINALVADEMGHYERIKAILKREHLNFRFMYSKGMPYVDPETCRTFGKG